MKFILIENYHVTDATLTIKALIIKPFFYFSINYYLKPKAQTLIGNSSIDTENVCDAIMQKRYGNLVLGFVGINRHVW